jgi:hypothetical protein
MKKLALVLALVLTAFAGSAFAQLVWQDNVGLYFNQTTPRLSCGTRTPDVPFNTYLVFTNLTSPTIKSWEIALAFDNVLLNGMYPLPADHNVMVSPRENEFMVGLDMPYPVVGGVYVAARLNLVIESADPEVPNTAPASVTPNGVFFHLLPTQVPAYINGAGDRLELRSVTETHTPFLIINGDCGVVGTEPTTFGEVKSLFR